MNDARPIFEYRIVWQQCPHIQHTQQVIFLRAVSEATARAVAKDQIERTHGCAWFTIHSCEQYSRPSALEPAP